MSILRVMVVGSMHIYFLKDHRLSALGIVLTETCGRK